MCNPDSTTVSTSASMTYHIAFCLANKFRKSRARKTSSNEHSSNAEVAAATMVFPFFGLPLDVRNIIYEYVLGILGPDIVFYPAASYRQCISRALRGLDSRVARHSILQTCQQAHDEGTDISYGTGMFEFDNINFGCNHEISMVSKRYCMRCHSTRLRLPCYDDTDRSYLQRANDIQHTEVEETDLMLMYRWLEKIGQRNRQKLRRLHVCFTPGAPGGRTEHSLSSDLYHNAGCLDLAFRLLGKAHRLNELHIRLGPYFGRHRERISAGERLQWERLRDHMRSAMSYMAGVGRFDIEEKSPDDREDLMEIVRRGLHSLKPLMESGVSKCEKSVVPNAGSLDRIDQAERLEQQLEER